MLVKNKKGFYQIKELLFPGLIHGFSTKKLGNMSFKYGEAAEVKRSRLKFAKLVGFNDQKVAQMDLVHETRIGIVTENESGPISEYRNFLPETDGLITDVKGLALWLLTGDCAPYLFYDPNTKVIGLVHSGWKGTVGKIALKAVAIMITKFDYNIEDILIGIGPSIEKCCYVNPRPNVEEFLPEWSEYVFNDSEKLARVDLNGFTINQLVGIGLPKENIFYSNFCTKDHSDEFFCSQEETAKITKPGRFATVIQMT